MSYEYLQISREEHVTTVTLSRAEALNALNDSMMDEIERLARGFAGDEQTRVVVLAGAGPHFCVGADLKQAAPEPRPSVLMSRRYLTRGARMIRALLEIEQITIAALHGAALGGGACIASACDLRIGTESCQVGYPEVKLGINLMWGALPLCVRLVGASRAKQMVALGNREPAAVLKEWGFLDEIVPTDTLLEHAAARAREYAARPPIAVQMIKRSIDALTLQGSAAIMHMDADQNFLSLTTHDRAEAVAAFFEKRKPDFTGN